MRRHGFVIWINGHRFHGQVAQGLIWVNAGMAPGPESGLFPAPDQSMRTIPALLPFSLRLTRLAIDGVDDAMVLLLAGRGRLAAGAARCKQRAGLAPLDPIREARIQARAQRLAEHVGLRGTAARALLDVVIDEGRARADPGQAQPGTGTGSRLSSRLLRLFPPPRRWAPLARRLPDRWQQRVLATAMARVLGPALADGELDFLRDRALGIDVLDLDLHWVIGIRDGKLCHVDRDPEASVRGTATDLLLLAGRLEDADTLFFQRRLVLTGDTELGLTARNLLEALRWEQVPLGLRIALDRGARLARAARAAHSP